MLRNNRNYGFETDQSYLALRLFRRLDCTDLHHVTSSFKLNSACAIQFARGSFRRIENFFDQFLSEIL